MFLQSLIAGAASLGQWQVALATLALLALYFGYSHTLGKTASLKESEGAAAPGCLFQILGTLLEGFAIGAYVLCLLPTTLPAVSQPNLPGLSSFALLAIRAGILASIALTLISLVPYLGAFLARRPGLQFFLMGVAVFRMTAPLYFERSAAGALGAAPHFPGFGLSLAYLALALLLSELLFWASRGLQIRRQPVLAALDILTGILPLLMYIQYVGKTVHP